MTGDERTRLTEWLEESRRQFLRSIEDVTPEQWTWRPAADRWSLGETAEHIVLSEGRLFSCVQRALAEPANADWENCTRGKTELIEHVMAPRLGRAKAPDGVVPSSSLTLQQTRQRFDRQRAEIAAFVETTQLPLRAHTLEHPMPVFGILNAWQWLIYVPLHTMRHCKQIEEIKATAGYP
jgi:uncharacterized damage-inducible protein DinB